MTHGHGTIPLKEGWRFIKDDDPDAAGLLDQPAMSDILDRAAKGDRAGAPHLAWAQPDFDDSAWRMVRVPHDWGVDLPFDSDRPYGDAFLDVTGVGWYRIRFGVPAEWRGKTVYFECDGAMSYAMVWVNGEFAGGWPYGYTRWRLDISDLLRHEVENTIAVRCHNLADSSRWYTGGGLYRNCRLLICPENHVVPGSVFIDTPEVTPGRATVRVRYTMSKDGPQERTFTAEKPHLWDIGDPYLHTVEVEGIPFRYGIRTIAFHADERRFQLNGRTVPLNGVSMHHDFGVLGAAWNRAAQRRRLLLFKEAGANAIRSSHNPPDEGLLELCDELGLLVFNEVFDEWRHIGNSGKRANGYTLLFDKWHERDVRAWVRVARNHPSVILYGIGNEICEGFPEIAPQEEYAATSRDLAQIVAEEDPTRPTVCANNNPANFDNGVPGILPVMGCNYFPWRYPALKASHPGVPFFGTETVCMSSSRGEYQFPVAETWKKTLHENFRNSAYCWEAVDWSDIGAGAFCPPDAQWHWMDKVGTCLGEFIWTGIDYLGGPYWCDDWRRRPSFTDPATQKRALEEVAIHGMTRAAIHSCNTGFLDTAGFRKDSFWLFQSRWRPDFPMAHILPHWNWEGREGEVTPVYVFTSGDEGELFLNGRSLGRRRKEPGVWNRAYRLRWDDVRYEPGVLEVVVFKYGAEWARDRVETTDAPFRIALEAETEALAADGEDFCYVNASVRDSRGRVVPTACNGIVFSIEGPGEIVATDNGDETDFNDFRQPRRKAFHGWVQAVIRAIPGAAGTIRVTAASGDLVPASLPVEARLPVAPQGDDSILQLSSAGCKDLRNDGTSRRRLLRHRARTAALPLA